MASLDSSGSLHGMGIIAVSTSKDNGALTANSRVINRQPRVKVDELVKDKGVPIIQYIGPHVHPLASILYKPIIEIIINTIHLAIRSLLQPPLALWMDIQQCCPA